MNGYVPKRRGVLDHLQARRLTLLEYGAYDAIILLADKASGRWWGSAKALAALCGAGDLTERQARHILESLANKGYIRRFATPRAHGNYPILIDKYLVTFGALSGLRLNAATSDDWRKPVYEKCLEHGAEQGAERAPIRDLRREKRDKAAAPPAAWKVIGIERPCGDQGFQEFWETSWAARNGGPLSKVMKGCADSWEAAGGRVPGPFFAALAEVRKRERDAAAGTDEDIVSVEVPV
jgi:hypothetical protein